MVRIEPDPEQLPCLGERSEIMIPTSTLYWTLPTNEFGILRIVVVGDVRTTHLTISTVPL